MLEPTGSEREASGSDGAAQGVGGTHADTGNVNVTGDMTGEGAESGGLRGSCSQMPHRGYDGPYYTEGMKEPICTNDYLYWATNCWYRISKLFWYQYWLWIAGIVIVCLVAAATWPKFAPWATGRTGSGRWFREETPPRCHAPKFRAGSRRGKPSTRHYLEQRRYRPRYRWPGSHRTAGPMPTVHRRRRRWAPRAPSSTPASWRRTPEGEKLSRGAHAFRRAACAGSLGTEKDEVGLVHNDAGRGRTTIDVDPVGTPADCCS